MNLEQEIMKSSGWGTGIGAGLGAGLGAALGAGVGGLSFAAQNEAAKKDSSLTKRLLLGALLGGGVGGAAGGYAGHAVDDWYSGFKEKNGPVLNFLFGDSFGGDAGEKSRPVLGRMLGVGVSPDESSPAAPVEDQPSPDESSSGQVSPDTSFDAGEDEPPADLAGAPPGPVVPRIPGDWWKPENLWNPEALSEVYNQQLENVSRIRKVFDEADRIARSRGVTKGNMADYADMVTGIVRKKLDPEVDYWAGYNNALSYLNGLPKKIREVFPDMSADERYREVWSDLASHRDAGTSDSGTGLEGFINSAEGQWTSNPDRNRGWRDVMSLGLERLRDSGTVDSLSNTPVEWARVMGNRDLYRGVRIYGPDRALKNLDSSVEQIKRHLLEVAEKQKQK